MSFSSSPSFIEKSRTHDNVPQNTSFSAGAEFGAISGPTAVMPSLLSLPMPNSGLLTEESSPMNNMASGQMTNQTITHPIMVDMHNTKHHYMCPEQFHFISSQPTFGTGHRIQSVPSLNYYMTTKEWRDGYGSQPTLTTFFQDWRPFGVITSPIPTIYGLDHTNHDILNGSLAIKVAVGGRVRMSQINQTMELCSKDKGAIKQGDRIFLYATRHPWINIQDEVKFNEERFREHLLEQSATGPLSDDKASIFNSVMNGVKNVGGMVSAGLDVLGLKTQNNSKADMQINITQEHVDIAKQALFPFLELIETLLHQSYFGITELVSSPEDVKEHLFLQFVKNCILAVNCCYLRTIEGTARIVRDVKYNLEDKEATPFGDEKIINAAKLFINNYKDAPLVNYSERPGRLTLLDLFNDYIFKKFPNSEIRAVVPKVKVSMIPHRYIRNFFESVKRDTSGFVNERENEFCKKILHIFEEGSNAYINNAQSNTDECFQYLMHETWEENHRGSIYPIILSTHSSIILNIFSSAVSSNNNDLTEMLKVVYYSVLQICRRNEILLFLFVLYSFKKLENSLTESENDAFALCFRSAVYKTKKDNEILRDVYERVRPMVCRIKNSKDHLGNLGSITPETVIKRFIYLIVCTEMNRIGHWNYGTDKYPIQRYPVLESAKASLQILENEYLQMNVEEGFFSTIWSIDNRAQAFEAKDEKDNGFVKVFTSDITFGSFINNHEIIKDRLSELIEHYISMGKNRNEKFYNRQAIINYLFDRNIGIMYLYDQEGENKLLDESILNVNQFLDKQPVQQRQENSIFQLTDAQKQKFQEEQREKQKAQEDSERKITEERKRREETERELEKIRENARKKYDEEKKEENRLQREQYEKFQKEIADAKLNAAEMEKAKDKEFLRDIQKKTLLEREQKKAEDARKEQEEIKKTEELEAALKRVGPQAKENLEKKEYAEELLSVTSTQDNPKQMEVEERKQREKRIKKSKQKLADEQRMYEQLIDRDLFTEQELTKELWAIFPDTLKDAIEHVRKFPSKKSGTDKEKIAVANYTYEISQAISEMNEEEKELIVITMNDVAARLTNDTKTYYDTVFDKEETEILQEVMRTVKIPDGDKVTEEQVDQVVNDIFNELHVAKTSIPATPQEKITLLKKIMKTRFKMYGKPKKDLITQSIKLTLAQALEVPASKISEAFGPYFEHIDIEFLDNLVKELVSVDKSQPLFERRRKFLNGVKELGVTDVFDGTDSTNFIKAFEKAIGPVDKYATEAKVEVGHDDADDDPFNFSSAHMTTTSSSSSSSTKPDATTVQVGPKPSGNSKNKVYVNTTGKEKDSPITSIDNRKHEGPIVIDFEDDINPGVNNMEEDEAEISFDSEPVSQNSLASQAMNDQTGGNKDSTPPTTEPNVTPSTIPIDQANAKKDVVAGRGRGRRKKKTQAEDPSTDNSIVAPTTGVNVTTTSSTKTVLPPIANKPQIKPNAFPLDPPPTVTNTPTVAASNVPVDNNDKGSDLNDSVAIYIPENDQDEPMNQDIEPSQPLVPQTQNNAVVDAQISDDNLSASLPDDSKNNATASQFVSFAEESEQPGEQPSDETSPLQNILSNVLGPSPDSPQPKDKNNATVINAGPLADQSVPPNQVTLPDSYVTNAGSKNKKRSSVEIEDDILYAEDYVKRYPNVSATTNTQPPKDTSINGSTSVQKRSFTYPIHLRGALADISDGVPTDIVEVDASTINVRMETSKPAQHHISAIMNSILPSASSVVNVPAPSSTQSRFVNPPTASTTNTSQITSNTQERIVEKVVHNNVPSTNNKISSSQVAPLSQETRHSNKVVNNKSSISSQVQSPPLVSSSSKSDQSLDFTLLGLKEFIEEGLEDISNKVEIEVKSKITSMNLEKDEKRMQDYQLTYLKDRVHDELSNIKGMLSPWYAEIRKTDLYIANEDRLNANTKQVLDVALRNADSDEEKMTIQKELNKLESRKGDINSIRSNVNEIKSHINKTLAKLPIIKTISTQDLIREDTNTPVILQNSDMMGQRRIRKKKKTDMYKHYYKSDGHFWVFRVWVSTNNKPPPFYLWNGVDEINNNMPWSGCCIYVGKVDKVHGKRQNDKIDAAREGFFPVEDNDDYHRQLLKLDKMDVMLGVK